MKLRSGLAFIVTALLLSACASSGNKGGLGGLIQGAIDNANEKTAPTVVTPGIAAGKTASIAGYRLGFEEIISKSSANRYGGANMTTQLHNVSAQDFEDITHQAYADFREKLTVAGFTVAEQDKVNKTPKLAGASEQKRNEAAPERNMTKELLVGRTFMGLEDHTRYLSPKGMKPLVYRTDGSFAGFTAMDDKIGEVASELKDNTVAVNLKVGFTKMSGSSWSGITGGGSNVSAKAQISIDPDTGSLFVPKSSATECSAFCNMAGNSTRMGVLRSNEGFGTIEDDTSTAQTAGALAGLAANVAMGGFGAGASVDRSAAVQADPALYKAETLKLIKEANSRIVMEMVTKAD